MASNPDSSSLDDLEQLLLLLRREGVTSFQRGDLKIDLMPMAGARTVEATKVDLAEPHEPAKLGYRHPSLWPTGEPPTFPGNS